MTRVRFNHQLQDLHKDILYMGELVRDELMLAMTALETLDRGIAKQVYTADEQVNAMRFATEEKCFEVIATQQPAARDLRAVVAVMNMIVDLERMGDQAKGIAKVVRHLTKRGQDFPRPIELQEMGDIVLDMLKQSMEAYQTDSVELALRVPPMDDKVDALFAAVFGNLMTEMAEVDQADKVKAAYEMLRAARELERFGDLATNIAERVVYRLTGEFRDMNEEDPS